MKRADIIVGLGFGDEGKGSMVDFLCRQRRADLVVRYNGGSQAAHNVVTDDGRHHTFQQIGSGAFAGAKTLLSRFMMVDPISLAEEVAVLSLKLGEDALKRHFIDDRAPVITPYHVMTNRIKEWHRGGERHGSCGKGIGELAADINYERLDVIRIGDLKDKKVTLEKLILILQRKDREIKNLTGINADMPDPRKLAQAYKEMYGHFNVLNGIQAQDLIRESNSVFEGAQGILLDESVGFHPYTTWSNTLSSNAHILLRGAGFEGTIETIGVIRSYATRHGAGPFVAEAPPDPRDCHDMGRCPHGIQPWVYYGENNFADDWQGGFRTGWFDGVMLKYALSCDKIDTIALTHTDAFKRSPIPYCNKYDLGNSGIKNFTPSAHRCDLLRQEALTNTLLRCTRERAGDFCKQKDIVDYIEKTGVPVKYISNGPKTSDKETIK